MDWSYYLCLRGLLYLLQCILFSVCALQHNINHYQIVYDFELDHFDGPLDFNGGIHVHMQSSLGL